MSSTITAVLPFFAYGRTDKKDQPRVPITARLIADMLQTAGANRVLTIDLHAGQVQGFFNVPVDELTAMQPLLRDYVVGMELIDPVVVAGDLGFAKRARNFADMIGASVAFVEKRRLGNNSRSESLGVIGDVTPQGLCGSGLVDAVAELVKVGLLDASGRFVPQEEAARIAPGLVGRLTAIDKERVFVLHRESTDTDPSETVYLSQRDVRELQFAKAAISTGWTLLLEELGLEHGDVQQVLLAGSFGSYLSAASAVVIGLVPKLPVLRIVSAGNVAGEGAKMSLLSVRERAGALALLEEVRYVELSDRKDFNDRFVDLLAFPT